ncbi:MAG: hypothetical protein V2I56_15040, partial [Desulfobacteraceae bacterium]|nr:hypothetical protein [Desulfobacteraceae bacterium]
NGRESLTWADIKISTSGYLADGDTDVWNAMSKDLGDDYTWTVGPNQTGGDSTFTFKGDTFNVSRVPSTRSAPAIWVRR